MFPKTKDYLKIKHVTPLVYQAMYVNVQLSVHVIVVTLPESFREMYHLGHPLPRIRPVLFLLGLCLTYNSGATVPTPYFSLHLKSTVFPRFFFFFFARREK